MKLAGLFSSPAGSTPSSSVLGKLFKPALGVALSLATAAAMAAPTNMKIATVVWIGYGPFYVAESLDLFKKYNLKVSLQVFTDPALIPPAIASGAVDGGMLTYDQVVGQVAAGKAMKVVMPIDYSNGGDAIVADGVHQVGQGLQGQEDRLQPALAQRLPAVLRAQGQRPDREGHQPRQHDARSRAGRHGLGPAAHRRDLRTQPVADPRPGRRQEVQGGVLVQGRSGPDRRRAGVRRQGHQGQAHRDQRPHQGLPGRHGLHEGQARRRGQDHRQVHGRLRQGSQGTDERRLQHPAGRNAQGLPAGQGHHLVLRQRRSDRPAAQGQGPDQGRAGDRSRPSTPPSSRPWPSKTPQRTAPPLSLAWAGGALGIPLPYRE